MSAANLAVFGNPGTKDLILYPLDTNAKTLEADLRSLAPHAIVGPVFAQDTRTLAPSIDTSIPMFTLSNDQTLVGRGMFVMGMPPQEEAQHILSFSLKQGHKKFVALLPDDAYGHALELTFKQMLEGKEEVESQVIFYSKTEDTPPETIKKWVANINAFEPHAIFVPDGTHATQKLISTLKFKDLDFRTLRFLGSAQWDRPGLLKDHSFKGFWMTSNRSDHSLRFIQVFQKYFDLPPTPVDIVLYDTLGTIGMVRQHVGKAALEKKDFIQENGFPGVYGRFILHPRGSAHRPWMIIQHTGGKPKRIG